jgi:fumarate hydratase class II
MMNQAMFHVMGNDHTVALAAEHGQLELNVMMPIIAHNLNEMMIVMIGSVKMFTEHLIVGLTANQDRAEGWLAKNPILVTALNPIIGYLKGADVAKKSLAENRSIIDIVVEAGYMTEDDARAALDARKLTEGGISEIKGGG